MLKDVPVKALKLFWLNSLDTLQTSFKIFSFTLPDTFTDVSETQYKQLKKLISNIGTQTNIVLTLQPRRGESNWPIKNLKGHISGTECRIDLKPGCKLTLKGALRAFFAQGSPEISLAWSILGSS